MTPETPKIIGGYMTFIIKLIFYSVVLVLFDFQCKKYLHFYHFELNLKSVAITSSKK